jgi:hypothetical protein
MLVLVPVLPLSLFAFLSVLDTALGAEAWDIWWNQGYGNPRENNWKWIAKTPLHYGTLMDSHAKFRQTVLAGQRFPQNVRVDSVLAVGKAAAPVPTVQDESPSNATWTDFSATA